MGSNGVLCAGIVVADHVSSPISHLPAAGELVLADQLILTIGGCAANVAVDLVRLGVPATVVGCVGDDVFGRVVADMLRERHVDVSGLRVRPGQVTSQTLIVNVKGQDRRFVHTFGANADFGPDDIPADTDAKVLYLGGYFIMDRLRPEALAKALARAQSRGIRTVLDVVTPGPADYLPRLEPVLPYVDVFLPNDHEAQLITGLTDPLTQAERFRAMGAGTAIITCGDRGSVLVTDRLRLRAGTYAMPFVDGTGGGDAFAAGYMAGMLRGWGPEECLRIGSAVGASCVRAIGTTAGVFTAAECDAFLKANRLPVERV
ncbi:MAG: carbohydrate kinase family protein [Gemmataceae bacterium]